MKSSFLRLVLALLVLLGSLAGYGAWYAAVSAQSTAAADIENKISVKRDAASRIDSARAALSEISGDEASVQNYFVSENEVVAFIDALEARGRAQGASVSVLSVANDKIATHPALSLSLRVTGTFDAVMRTVGSIEYSPYDLSLKTLSLGLDGKNAWHADLSIVVGTGPSVTGSGAASKGTPTSTPQAASSTTTRPI